MKLAKWRWVGLGLGLVSGGILIESAIWLISKEMFNKEENIYDLKLKILINEMEYFFENKEEILKNMTIKLGRSIVNLDKKFLKMKLDIYINVKILI